MGQLNNFKNKFLIVISILIVIIWGKFTMGDVAGIIMLAGFFIVYCAFVFLVLYKCDVGMYLNKESNVGKIIIIVVSICSVLFMYSWVSRDQFIYYWDYGTYWEKAIRIVDGAFSNPVETFMWIINSVNVEEYNQLQAAFISFPFALLGKSFLSFSLVVTIFYLIPSFFVGSIIVRKILIQSEIEVPLWKIYISISLFANVYRAIGYGYGDIAAVLMMLLTFLILFSMDKNRFDYSKCILLSITLLMPVLLRRYFGYWGLATVICIIPYLIFSCELKNFKTKIRLVLKKLILIGVMDTLILVIFFKGFIRLNLFNNYGIAYTAYNTKSWILKVKEFTTGIGIFLLIITLIGLTIYIIKKQESRKDTIFILSNSIIATFLYLCNQQMALQHYYIGSFQIAILLCIATIYLIEIIKYKNILMCTLIIVYIMNFLYAFSLVPSNIIGGDLFTYQYFPKIRTDIDVIRQLNKKVREDKFSYLVLSSSSIFSDDILNKVTFPDIIDRSTNLKYTSHVDLVNGFPEDFLTVDRVIVCYPVQYHLEPLGQQSVGILAEEVLTSRSKIGDNFRYIEEYQLDDGVIARIYEKKSNFTNSDIQYLIDRFNVSYSNYPELFENRIKKYKN